MNLDNRFSSPAFPLQPPPQVLCNSDSDSTATNKCEHVFVTLIRATNVVCGLRRMPAGFHVIVEVDERTIQTSNKPVSTEKDAVEWDEEILLPSNQSSSISFSVYASFELGPRLGNGELLRQLKITAGEVFHRRNEQLQLIDFTTQKSDILPSCSSFSIITERRLCDANKPCPKLDLPESCEMNALEQLTDEGHRALLRYRQHQDQMDLDAANQTFERVQEICPIDHPNRSAVLFNLANAKFIDRSRYLDLDAPIGLYRDALRLRRKNHPDHCTTVLGLGLALLTRFQRRGFNFDGEEAINLLAGVVEVSAAESYAYRTGLFALQMAKASQSVEAGNPGSPQAEQVNHGDVIQQARDLLRNLSYYNPRRPAILVDLGVLLSDRFRCNGALADIHEAISMFECAIDLMPHGHPDMLSLLDDLGSELLRRFNHLGHLTDMNRSISTLEEAICLTPDGHPDKPHRLNSLGNSLLTRFERLGDLTDLNKSISMFEEACLTPDGHPDKPTWLNNLGKSLCRRSERLKDLADLDKSILMIGEAVCLTADSHPNKPVLLNNLGNSLLCRFEHLGDLANLNRSISVFQEAVGLTPDGHPNKPGRLNNLGQSLCRRFERLEDFADLNRSISMREEVICLTPNDHPDKPGWLNNLWNLLLYRFERLGDLVDLSRSISVCEEAVSLTPDGHLNKPVLLNNLANLICCRFECLGDLADLLRSNSIFQEAVYLTPDGHSDKPAWLNNLGNSLRRRFERLGDLADLNRSISIFQEVVGLTPDGHPDKPGCLNNLGNSLCRRFERLGALADLNTAISIFEGAVYLTPDGHPNKPGHLNNFGHSLLCRFERLGDLVDLNRSISIFQEVVGLTPDGHPNKPGRLSNLGKSFCRRFQRLGDLVDLNRSILVREEVVCLTPDGHPDKPAWLIHLGDSLCRRFERLGDLADLIRSNSVFEDGVCLTPNGHPNKPAWLNYLGISLRRRFERLGDLADVNRSILMFEEAVCLTPDSHPDKPGRLNSLGNSLLCRFEHLGDLADLNRSISMFQEVVSLTPDDRLDKPVNLNSLGTSLDHRFERLGDLADLNRSISLFEEAVSLTPNGHPDKPRWLNNFGNSLCHHLERLGDLAKLNRSILVFEEAVCLTPNGHPDKPRLLNNLGDSLCRRFERLGDLADIVKSISVYEEAISFTPDGHPDKATLLISLGDAFNNRFKCSRDSSDLSAAIFNFSIASRASIGRVSTRFHGARAWISCAQLQGNATALLDACASAFDLLPQLAWLGLPVTERHRLLVKAADVTRDSVAAALETGHPELAVEWLEQGRSIVWAQFLQLRTPVHDLGHEHSALARQFRQISQELERASTRDSGTFCQPANISVADTRSLETDVQRHHDLALKREKLLAEIRSLPGFDRFLLSKTVKQLATLAVSGPVVYLTANRRGCGALIVMKELESVTHVPLPGICYEHMETLRKMLRAMLERHCLVLSRDALYELTLSEDMDLSKQFLDLLLDENFTDGSDRAVKTKQQRVEGYTPNELYQMILKHLWNHIVIPVLHVLGFSNPPSGTDKMTRIFWCPTGLFSFLPIHAAGLYDTAEPGTKLSDFAVSSYLPTLSSLASSPQNSLNDPSSKLRLLAVPQPPTDGLSKLFSVEDEISSIKELSDKSPFVTLQNSDGTVEDVMEKLKETDWAHFACHGIQDPKKPLDSGLGLANNCRLKLSDIMQLSRPQGGLAFLSACQTAQGDETLSEESVHLAAGMLLAGYGSVIGTMWAIRDDDAPKVARDVYEHLFRDAGRVPDSTEAAVALHRAIQHLRDSGAPFTSWVPFIHFGR